MQHHLVAVACSAAIEVCRQGRLGQPPKRVGATLRGRQRLGHRVAVRRGGRLAKQPVGRGLDRTLHHGADLGREASPNRDHAVIVHPGGELALQMPRLRLPRRLHPVHAPPDPDDTFDVRAVAGQRQIEERRFGVGRGHPRERPYLRVGDLPALHGRADAWQGRQGLGHAHLFARGAKVNARTPVQPVRARQEAVVPSRALVELVQQYEQFIGGGVEPRGQGRNRLAEGVGVGWARERQRAWRGVTGESVDAGCSEHVASYRGSFCCRRMAPARRSRRDPPSRQEQHAFAPSARWRRSGASVYACSPIAARVPSETRQAKSGSRSSFFGGSRHVRYCFA